MSNETNSITQALRDAQALLARGDVAQARRRCEAIVRAHPFHGAAYNIFAIVEYQRGDLHSALALVERAVSIEPKNPDFLNSCGIVLQTIGRFDDALASYDQALAVAPRQAQTLYNRGIALHATGRLEEALASYRQALEAQPKYPEALVNQGNVLQALKRFDEALACYDSALGQEPRLANGHVNRGIALQALNRPQEALENYDRALALHARYPDALLNRGIALEALGRPTDALADYEKALRLEPQSKALRMKRADILQDLGRIDEALETYHSILETPIASAEEEVVHHRVAVEMFWGKRKLCAWDNLADVEARARQSLRAGVAPPNPFISLCAFDDPAILLDCATRYSAYLRRGSARMLAQVPRHSADRIRIGYFSGDLRDHATSYLLAGVFEAHDRSRFEIRAYSYGPDDRSPMRTRLTRAFDAFVDAREMSDVQLVERVAADRVHILVDLDGYTRRNRAPVLQFRPAPICAHYLGYPGTLGSPDVDYLIADSYVIPSGAERFFREAIVRLPGSYQANDDGRVIPDLRQTRRDAGLPADAFVFCAFNRPYKITPAVFDVWMRVLNSVPASVLWLLRDSERVESNLKREAALRGVDARRLVFAPRAPLDEHLARHRLADLFLDTWPVCAHTSSDALWAGLPIITQSARPFVSRVAGSLLTAVGLPELIASSAGAYEKSAIALARNPDDLARLRAKLAANRRAQPLFDTKRSCRNLEAAFEAMWSIYERGEAPRGFTIGDDRRSTV